MKDKNKKTIEERFIKLSPVEHILKRPSMYISSVVTEPKDVFVVDNIENLKIIKKSINFNRGFFAIIDEVLTNASDAFIRNGNVKIIKVIIGDDYITVENDGGIPVEIHKKEKMYVPELIFSHLHSGENFTDTDERLVAGTHGLGVKLTNIFSKKFIIETSDGKNKYYQEFTDNMSKKIKPNIKPCKKNYTKVTFYPDFNRFGLTEIDSDIKSVILRRCVDISVYCQGVKVYVNNVLIPVKSFKDYMKLFINNDSELFTEKINDNFEIGISKSLDNSFNQVSIVNGITTYNGGTHVNVIINDLTKKTQEILAKKYKKLNIKPNDIKNNTFIFVSAKILNPSFDTQTKETLITKINGNSPELSEKLIKQFSNSKIIEDVIRFLNIKEQVDTKKEIGKHKIKISKLDDAKKAGTFESDKCLLFLAEGDSASSSIIAGLSEVDSSYFGVFPLKGKPMNCRDVNLQKVRENEEIKSIINILGLEFGKKYTETSKLRYGKVVLMADADCDGNHIRGLIINLFDTFWPELLSMNFLQDFTTPIIKCTTKGNKVKYFYRLEDYKKEKDNLVGSEIKWIKGLGTIEPNEMKSFFKNINKHLIRYHYDVKMNTEDLIDLAFNSKRANDRKEWMKNYNPVDFIDKFTTKQTYDKFINNELMDFSMSDNIRTIPSIVDGLKPSQRKVIYTLYKKNIKGEIKVSSLSGSIIEIAAYHQGNISLEQTIIAMAQDFVGTNNINLLLPKGQFGSRLKGGDDSASPRYIFTKLNDLTHSIFRKEDNDVLTYQNDDGFPIEPNFYVPIIPTILMNGAAGIGYGYSTDIPSFNPVDLITYLQNKIKDKKNIELNPYYKYFKGKIIMDLENKRYISRGLMDKISDYVYEIKELPLWTWNNKYFEFLDDLSDDKKDDKGKLIRKAYIRDWTKDGNEKDIKIKIYLTRDVPKEFLSNIWKSLKMETYIPFGNMHLFDENKKIKKFDNQYDIINHYFNVRLDYYNKRKLFQIKQLKYDIEIIRNRMLFIKNVIDDKLKINKRTREDIEKDIIKLDLMKVNDGYSYLLNMSIVSLTKEKLIELKEEFEKNKEKLKILESIKIEDIWLDELDELKKKLK